MRRQLFVLTLISLLVVLSGIPVQAQRSVYWESWNVIIDDVDINNNSFTVEEQYSLVFRGTFNFGFREIPLGRTGSINNVRVLQNGRVMQESCTGADGTACLEREDGNLVITYEFFNTVSDETIDITIRYDVTDGIRSYEGGDQIWWIAIPEDRPARVDNSFILVNLPEGAVPRQGTDPVVTYGAPSEVDVCTEERICNGVVVTDHLDEREAAQVVAQSTRTIYTGENFEVRVQYPHNPEMPTPGWQQLDDLSRQAGVLMNYVGGLIALILGFGGPLLMFIRYYNTGRDPKTGIVPEYLSTPPSNIPPAVVGALVDEKADLQDVFATLIDLAHRGYVVFEEERSDGVIFGIGASSEITLKRTSLDENKLEHFEQDILHNIFKHSKKERKLSDLKNSFYKHISSQQKKIYGLLVEYGFFQSSPEQTRNYWLGGGILLLVIAGITFFFANIRDDEFVFSIWTLLNGALFVNGLIILIFSQFMPAKTRKGAIEAAKWNAFRKYLDNLERYDSTESAADKFDDYLPYAVAFGLDKKWIRHFTRSKANVPIPGWYYPRYLEGPYSRPFQAGSSPPRMGGFSGGLEGREVWSGDSGGGDFSLDNMAGGISGGLENISDSLTNMLNETSSVLQSQPSSSGSSGSWSGGGGSFSGGGFSGGGGGGGSAGFG